MPRIIAGDFGGRTFQVPPRGTRPTSDRVREAIFSTLNSAGVLQQARVLDLFAGSGGLGLEAISRGADRATFVESDARAARVCRDNAASLGARSATIREMKVATYLQRPAELFDLVFVDPPYDLESSRLAAVLEALQDWVAGDGLVVVERSTRSAAPALPTGLEVWRERKYGETTVMFLQPPAASLLPQQEGLT